MAKEELKEEIELTPEVRKHDIFEDPAITRSLKEDPVLRVITRWWQPILIAVLAVVAASYARNKFTETYNASLGDAAALYVRASTELGEVETAARERREAAEAATKAGEKDEAAAKKLSEADSKVRESRRKLVEAMASLADAQAPYGGVADLYKGMLAVRDGGVADVKEAVEASARFESAKSETDRFYAELRALVLARALLDDDRSLSEGRARLKDLAAKASFVNVSAAITLARIAVTAEERAEAKAVMEAIISAHPEQASVLEDEFARVKA